jgi:hypothetical protein
VQRPLWWISGSPGAGKSALTPLLRARLPGWVVFEGEAIDYWRFEGKPGEYSSLHNQWLKVAHEIAVNAIPVVVLATALPEQLDACTMRNRFSAIHFLGLVCTEEEQTRRLRARPAWRESASPDFVESARGFTRRLHTHPRRRTERFTLLDTTRATPEDTADIVAAWARETDGDGQSHDIETGAR